MEHQIVSIFSTSGNLKTAKEQAAYMKNKFAFFGLKTPFRRDLQRPFLLKGNLPEKQDAFKMVEELWRAPQRELHYFSQELLFKYAQQFEKSDVSLLEMLITQNSWWDTIDFIATKPLAEYFKLFPEERLEVVDRWLDSGNIWLQRSALLFQLKYKSETDLFLLTRVVLKMADSKEFFIQKAIGWILREYSKTDPKWVLDFVKTNELQPLSVREALRIIQTQ